MTEAVLLAPFNCTPLVWAGRLSWIAFREPLYPMTLAGVAMIVASGLYVLWRERVSGRPSKP